MEMREEVQEDNSEPRRLSSLVFSVNSYMFSAAAVHVMPASEAAVDTEALGRNMANYVCLICPPD